MTETGLNLNQNELEDLSQVLSWCGVVPCWLLMYLNAGSNGNKMWQS